MAETIQNLTDCTREEAEAALAEHKEVWRAVDALMTRPPVAGDKYIPAEPEIDRGMSQEQLERCVKGRWLQAQVNAVFSVAHSKTLPDPPALKDAGAAPQSVEIPSVSAQSPPSS